MTKENVIIKKDTTSNWNKAKNFIPKDGEIIIYEENPRSLKIGDGTTKINDLPFIGSTSYYVENKTLIIVNNGTEGGVSFE